MYDLIKKRLSPRGVLQQWIQLHRVSVLDLATVLTTIRAQFQRVWLYFVGRQGIIIACNHDCRPGPDTLERLKKEASMADILGLIPNGIDGILTKRRSRVGSKGSSRHNSQKASAQKIFFQQMTISDWNTARLGGTSAPISNPWK